MEVVNSKYFIAIVPPEPIKSELYHLKQQFSIEFNTKGALRSPAHITLHMPFEYKIKKESQIIDFLTAFSKYKSPFNIKLKNLGAFEPKVIFTEVVKDENLNQLFNTLNIEIKPGLQLHHSTYKNKGFHPHITLAFRDLKKTNFYVAWEKYKSFEIDKDFICNSITLLKHNGKVWEEYKEFAFEGNQNV